jgi:defect-in-organelle-trafficking protein DotD
MKKIGIYAFIFIGLQGCASNPSQLYPDDSDPVAKKIAILGEQMVANSNKLANLERARYLRAGNAIYSDDFRELPVLQKTVNLGEAYNGPLEAFLKELSSFVGMNPPRFLGLKPSSGVLVSTKVQFRPLIDILDDIGQQTGTRAVVVYKATDNLLEVTYRGI